MDHAVCSGPTCLFVALEFLLQLLTCHFLSDQERHGKASQYKEFTDCAIFDPCRITDS